MTRTLSNALLGVSSPMFIKPFERSLNWLSLIKKSSADDPPETQPLVRRCYHGIADAREICEPTSEPMLTRSGQQRSQQAQRVDFAPPPR